MELVIKLLSSSTGHKEGCKFDTSCTTVTEYEIQNIYRIQTLIKISL